MVLISLVCSLPTRSLMLEQCFRQKGVVGLGARGDAAVDDTALHLSSSKVNVVDNYVTQFFFSLFSSDGLSS